MEKSFVLQLGDWFLYGAAVSAAVLATTYGLRSRWTSSRAGIVLFAWFFALAAVLSYNAVAVFYQGVFPGRPWVRLALYAALFLFSSAWTVGIVSLQNDARRERKRVRRDQKQEH